MAKFSLLTSITLDAAGFTQGNQKVKAEFNGLTDTIKDGNSQAGKSFTELGNKVAEPQRNVRELMLAYRNLKNVSFKGKTVEEIEEIKAEMASLYDQIGDLNNEIKAQSQDPFQKYAQGAQGVTTMLQGVVGVQTLFGAKSEAINELMAKTVGLMGISNALQQASVFTKENALGIEIRLGVTKLTNLIRENALQRLANAAQVEGAATTGILANAQRILNTVMAANPIGLLIAGVVALTAVAVTLAVALSSDNDEFEKQAQLIASLGNQQKSLIRDYERTAAINKARGETDIELLRDKLKELYKEDDLNQRQIYILETKKKLTDEEKTQYDDLIKKRDDYTNAINETNTAIQVAQITQLKDAKEFNNQLLISLKTGKANELATLEDWKQKSEEKYKNNADVILTITDSYNQKRLAIITKYANLIKAANSSINDILLTTGQNGQKNINSSISGVKDESLNLGGESEVKIKPIDPATMKSMQNMKGILTSMSIGYNDATASQLQFAASQQAVQSSFANLNGVLSQGAASFKEFGAAIKTAVKGIIATLLGESVAMLVTNAMSSLAKTPYGFLLVPAAASLASGIAKTMFNTLIPKFETGGIVGGTSFSGDKVLAAVNSGEMILNQRQQANLFDMLNNSFTNQLNTFEFKIKNDTLAATLNNYNRKQNYR